MLADFVIISTPDLSQYLEKSVTGIYLPNLVDIDHFKPDNKIIAESNNSHLNQNKKEALTIDNEILNIKQALDYLKYNNINLNVEVHDRMKCPIMHSDMPNFPKGYKVYVDVRYVNNTIIPALSKTALEALRCGLSVMDYQLRYRECLPEDHLPTNVISRLMTNIL
jgi:hypothetical protein